MKVAETKQEAKAELDLVKELTGEILRRKSELGWTDKELAAAAKKKSASTFYGWRNKTRKNPSLLDLQAFARAVGLDVRLIPHDAVSAGNGYVIPGREVDLHPETADVVKMMEAGSAELRAAIKDRILALVTERASVPLDADAEQPGHRVRSK